MENAGYTGVEQAAALELTLSRNRFFCCSMKSHALTVKDGDF
jgi:hypothetical protein